MKIEHGQVAVITGGASGIGYGLAEALGARGVKLVIADVRQDGLDKAVDSLRSAGFDTTGVLTDVSDAGDVQRLADATIAAYGRVDLVCNNAGIVAPERPMWEQEQSTWERMISIKFMGVVNGVRAFAPLLLAQGSGHILNTASSGGLMPLPTMTPYNGTMHAVVGMTETLDLELRGVAPSVGATVLCPGLVATALGENSIALGAIPAPTDSATAVNPEDAAAIFGEVLTPAQVAEQTIAAIEADRVHVIPGAGVFPMVRARVQSVLDDIPATVR